MKAKVLMSFSGNVLCASVGQEIEINDEAMFEDLKQAGYISCLESSEPEEVEEVVEVEEEQEAPAPKRRRKKV